MDIQRKPENNEHTNHALLGTCILDKEGQIISSTGDMNTERHHFHISEAVTDSNKIFNYKKPLAYVIETKSSLYNVKTQDDIIFVMKKANSSL